MWPLLIIAWVIYHFVSGWGVAAAHKTFLVESTAMESVAATLATSNLISHHLGDNTVMMMNADVRENFKDVACTPAKPPYKRCSFTTTISGPGNSNPASRNFTTQAGGGHAFANPFTWGEISATVDTHRNCPTCTDMAITDLQVDLHAKRQWSETAKDVAASVGGTVATNIVHFIWVEAINQIFGLSESRRLEHDFSATVVSSYNFMRIKFVVAQDHDGDGDVSGADRQGWNHIAQESAVLVSGQEVMGLFSTAGDGSLGHYVAAHGAAAASAATMDAVGMGGRQTSLRHKLLTRQASLRLPKSVDTGKVDVHQSSDEL